MASESPVGVHLRCRGDSVPGRSNECTRILLQPFRHAITVLLVFICAAVGVRCQNSPMNAIAYCDNIGGMILPCYYNSTHRAAMGIRCPSGPMNAPEYYFSPLGMQHATTVLLVSICAAVGMRCPSGPVSAAGILLEPFWHATTVLLVPICAAVGIRCQNSPMKATTYFYNTAGMPLLCCLRPSALPWGLGARNNPTNVVHYMHWSTAEILLACYHSSSRIRKYS